MQQRNKIVVTISSIVLAGTLAFGTVASAAGGDDGTGAGNGRPKLTTEEKCAKVDEVQAHAAEVQQRISERTTVLQGKRAEAEAAGDTAKVERLDARLARLQRVSARMEARLAKVTTWAAGHCAT
ncbi:MAG: hypothetical protein WCC60_15715 [Ilumatobacteraceae bacterium]